MRVCFIGAAPISEDVLNVLRVALGCMIYNGYGQTECSGAACASSWKDATVGTAPLVCNELKLVDVPDMKYFSKDDKGEVCIRGPNVMKGYYKNESKTKETVDEDGWLHTGDIGCWTKHGSLKIIDRKKNIFKLSQGEYVAPEKIENIYQTCASVGQIFVHGDSFKSCLVAIVVPDLEVFEGWCKEKGLLSESVEDLCKQESVHKAVLDEMTKVGRSNNLKGFELARSVYLDSKPWLPDTGLVTPTLKTKRPQLLAHYETEISEMYEKLG